MAHLSSVFQNVPFSCLLQQRQYSLSPDLRQFFNLQICSELTSVFTLFQLFHLGNIYLSLEMTAFTRVIGLILSPVPTPSLTAQL